MIRQNKEAFNTYLSAVSKSMGITKSLILSKSRHRDVTAARHMLWKLCKDKPMRLTTIRRLMKERGHTASHTAILYGIRSMNKKFKEDRNYEEIFKHINNVYTITTMDAGRRG